MGVSQLLGASQIIYKSLLSFNSRAPWSPALTPPSGVNEGVSRGRMGRAGHGSKGPNLAGRFHRLCRGTRPGGVAGGPCSGLGVSGAWPAAGVGAGRTVEVLWAWSGAGAGPEPVPTRPPAEARKGPFALPSPPGPHGGRSCGPRTRREPSSGEEAAPVTAMAAESALQVVEKLQARLATNPDPKKVSGGRAGGTGGRWARRGPGNGRGPGAAGALLGPGARPRGAARGGEEFAAGGRVPAGC